MNALAAEPPPAGVTVDACLSIWSEESQPRPVKTNRPRARILYAEDDASLRRAGQIILSHEGYSVTTVPDGAEAFSALHLDSYDLLITDNNMPRLSGLELITKLAEVQIKIPTIMASGSISDLMEAELREIKRRGAVLAKPFSPEQLLATINEVLAATNNGALAPGQGRLDPVGTASQSPPCTRWGINE